MPLGVDAQEVQAEEEGEPEGEQDAERNEQALAGFQWRAEFDDAVGLALAPGGGRGGAAAAGEAGLSGFGLRAF